MLPVALLNYTLVALGACAARHGLGGGGADIGSLVFAAEAGAIVLNSPFGTVKDFKSGCCNLSTNTATRLCCEY